VIIKAIQTCEAAPSQWDLWDETGQFYYARYRSGRGTVCLHNGPNWYNEQLQADLHLAGDCYIAEWRYGDRLDGYMELPQFCELSGLELSNELGGSVTSGESGEASRGSSRS
jgi:hypothetical protein